MRLYIFCAISLMVVPVMAASDVPNDKMNDSLSLSWEEEMEAALRELDIELEKVRQSRILEASAHARESKNIEENEDFEGGRTRERTLRKRMPVTDLHIGDDHGVDFKVELKASDECEILQVTFRSVTDYYNFHLPNACSGYESIAREVECDEEHGIFPTTCSFHQMIPGTLKKDVTIEPLNTTSLFDVKDEDESLETEGETNGTSVHRRLKKRGRRTKQHEWVARAIKKVTESEGEGSCTPASKVVAWAGHNNCDMSSEYTVKSGLDRCFKRCDREGQLAMNHMCDLTGWGIDAHCNKDYGSCWMSFANKLILIVDVLSTFLSGGVGKAFIKAAKFAGKAATKTLAKASIGTAIKMASYEFAYKLWRSGAIQKKIAKYNKKMIKSGKGQLQQQVMVEGSELYLAGSMQTGPSWGIRLDELAEAIDPTGIYSLVKGMIPKASCDEIAYMDEDIPDTEDNLEDVRPLDLWEFEEDLNEGKMYVVDYDNDVNYHGGGQWDSWSKVSMSHRDNHAVIKQISASGSGEHVYAVSTRGKMFFKFGYRLQSTYCPRTLKQVVVDNFDVVWGLDPWGVVYKRLSRYNWKRIGIQVVQMSISGDGNFLWTSETTKDIYIYFVLYNKWVNMTPWDWRRHHGGMKYVSVSCNGDHVWAISERNNIYYRNGYVSSWIHVPNGATGGLTQIEVSCDGSDVWGSSPNGNTYHLHAKYEDWRTLAWPQWKKPTFRKFKSLSIS